MFVGQPFICLVGVADFALSNLVVYKIVFVLIKNLCATGHKPFANIAADFLCVGGTSMRWGEIPCDGRTHAVRCTSCWVRNIGGSWLVAWILARLPASLSAIGKHFHNKLGTALSLQQLFQGRERQIQWMLQNSDQIVAVSKWLYYVLHLNGVAHEKITLCRHGLPEELIPVVRPESKPTSDVLQIGFIGRFSYVKGVHLLITAMKRLPRSMRVELKLFGRANTLEEKKYLAKLMKMSVSVSRIVFCGELTKENKKKVFESIDILAVPSIWFETGPLVVLEYRDWETLYRDWETDRKSVV